MAHLLPIKGRFLIVCRQHQQWTLYYNTWQRMAEQFVWQEEFERAAAEAEAMRTDAAKRNNLDAAAQALDSAFSGGKFFFR